MEREGALAHSALTPGSSPKGRGEKGVPLLEPRHLKFKLAHCQNKVISRYPGGEGFAGILLSPAGEGLDLPPA